MKYRIFTRAPVLGMMIVLAGCAARPDCTGAIETAEEAAVGRQPPGAWTHRVDAACTGAAMQTWSTVLAGKCAPVYGFHAAYNGTDRPAQCRNPAFDSAWNLGVMLSEMEGEAAEIERRLKDRALSSGDRRDLERRLVVIGRDLPQIEALARMDGYLPPAEIPGSDREIPE